ncbi:MAG: aminotransferase class III-fold pyridoxal phosphate-dependent enzyme [Gammaproteobacteria bacterium]|nr:aminotransferase class III-fold pyridoxal phosphate-dependent enzyme [Gammaproteobacteria bacterium]MBU0788299.1 aminotransferase class III-fold pyridoxal phosphate-dependent enzyme [Gammaproteobacteria bacterium]MBU0815204.1 aminotransferase class III-fold pyridoxal phosphate-dependent enzyme [Gammaproteobacteria bacterium]MBU1785688.1 aminotransferase class III-fold pyridoxal phosphate-dependent enzyme [Gammaproteobacteria bacterium]
MAGYIFSLVPQNVPEIHTEHRLIKTPIPAPGTAEVFARLDKVESRSMHGQLPLVWDKANDFSVYDIAGNRWIDFTSTIFVANVGHSNRHVTAAIKETLEHPLYSCYAYANPVRAKYLEKLISFAGKPFEKAFLLSAGTEATEAALKLMRMHGQRGGKRRRGIICIEGNWHGRTMGAQLLSSNLAQRAWIGFHDADIHHISFPYPWALKGATPEEYLTMGLETLEAAGVDLAQDVCGFMLETFQGWGAVFYPKAFVQAIEKLCRQHGILLAFDEMQAGFGRTGKHFGFQHYEVTPDLIACGKGMGGGVSLSGVIGRAEIMDLPEIGNMSSTHSANPLVCAAGLAVIEELEGRNLVVETARKGELLFKGLSELKQRFPDRIGELLGRGLIAAVLFRNPATGEADGPFTSRVAERCMQKGLLVVHTGRESIKIGPPLTISDAALLEGVAVIGEAIGEIVAEGRA